MSLARQDRDDLNAMHSLANGTGSGTSSVPRKRSHDRLESKSIWSRSPTVIPKPTNRTPSFSNPYSQGSYDDLTRDSQHLETLPQGSRRNPSTRTLVPTASSSHSGTRMEMQEHSDKVPAAKKQRTQHASSGNGAPSYGRFSWAQDHRSANHALVGSSSMPSIDGIGRSPTRNSQFVSTSGRLKSSKSASSATSENYFALPSPSTSSEVIDVDQDEDLGERVSQVFHDTLSLNSVASSDEPHLVPGEGRNNSVHTIGHILGVGASSHKQAFNETSTVQHTKSRSTSSITPHTHALKQQLRKYTHISSTGNKEEDSDTDIIGDPNDFDDILLQTPDSTRTKRTSTPSGRTEFRANHVRDKVSLFESRTRREIPPPELDLTTKIKPSTSRVTAMRKKGTNVSGAKPPSHAVDSDKSPEIPRKGLHNPPVSQTDYQYRTDGRSKGLQIPLEGYACGKKVYNSVDANNSQAKYWLQMRGRIITIIDSTLEKKQAVMELELGKDIRDVDVPSNDETIETFALIIFHLHLTNGTRNFFIDNINDYDEHNQLMIKPLTSHPSWSADQFTKFRDLLKLEMTPRISYLTATAFRSIWKSVLTARNDSSSHTPPSQISKQRSTYTGAVPSTSKLKPSEPEDVRRSARQSAVMAQSIQSDRSPSPAADEVILLYPPTGTGVVNVTHGDLKRLEPGEFLNDTLIELGLKLWLNDLRIQRPEIADQVHVFSSFFYTQLNQKNIEEGYQSVRKWTSKFDLFKKKYVIVPINEHLHWYLAIICHPQRTLQRPLPVQSVEPNVTAHVKARDATTANADVERLSPLRDHPSNCQDIPASPRTLAEDEQEVEGAVCVSSRSDGPSITTSPSPPSRSATAQLSVESVEMNISPAAAEGAYEVDENDDGDTSMESILVSPRLGPAKFGTPMSPKTVYPAANAVWSHTANVKSPSEAGDEEVVEQSDDDVSMDVDVAPPATSPELAGSEKACIFSFDSLGKRHPRALEVLSQYLTMEASDKKGWTDALQAVTKQALVPGQTNYCDCGVYLLHFVEQFMSEPETFSHHILQSSPKKINRLERERLWSHDKVAGRRQAMKQKIQALSVEWKQEKQAGGKGKGKEKEKVWAESTEAPASSLDHDFSDIEVLETNHEPNKTGQTPRLHRTVRQT